MSSSFSEFVTHDQVLCNRLADVRKAPLSPVCPCDQQPFRPGHDTEYPSSVRFRATLYFMRLPIRIAWPSGNRAAWPDNVSLLGQSALFRLESTNPEPAKNGVQRPDLEKIAERKLKHSLRSQRALRQTSYFFTSSQGSLGRGFCFEFSCFRGPSGRSIRLPPPLRGHAAAVSCAKMESSHHA